MLQEGYMLQVPGEGTQHSIKARIIDLIGEKECNRFYSLWLQNHTTRKDIDALSKWGFNSVRLPMHFNLFTLPVWQEPDSSSDTWRTDGFLLVDSLVRWCKANNMYLILDLHAAPGGQGNDINISDNDRSKPSLWQSSANRRKTVALWRKLAERYANEPTIGAYDIMNEPNWTFEGKHPNGAEDKANTEIWELYKDITAAIREVDKRHIIIIEGNGWGNNYSGFPGPWDSNMVFSFHKYWNANDVKSIQPYLDLRQKYEMPLWLGESGENSNTWFTSAIALAEANGIGWSWWPLKKVGAENNPYTIQAPAGYDQLLSYWKTNKNKPTPEFSSKVLFQLIENLKAQHCTFNPDVVDAMIRQVGDTTTLPYAENKIPGRILCVNYDLGRVGKAYWDTNFDRVDGAAGHIGGNLGRAYRNDGVDIEATKPGNAAGTDYIVVATADGEWMKYTVTAKRKSSYTISAMVGVSTQEGHLTVIVDGNEVATKDIQPSLEEVWRNVEVGKINLTKGEHTIKILIGLGGLKLAYLDIK